MEKIGLPEVGSDVREQRVWRIFHVAQAVWAFFAVFDYWRGLDIGTHVCVSQSVFLLVLLATFWRSKNYQLLMHCLLGSSVFGLWWIATYMQQFNDVIYFIPITIVMASLLFGTRQSFLYLLCSILAFVAHFLVVRGVDVVGDQLFDEVMIAIFIPVCIFLACQQAESQYRAKTAGLIEFSEALKVKSEHLQRQATTDSLTSLTNRFQFQIDLDEVTATATPSKPAALFLVDMDGFKEINDALGHPTGDEVLRKIGQRLNDRFGKRSIVARLGGDEFCILFDSLSQVSALEDVARELHELLTRPYSLSETGCTLGSSVGFAICPDHALTAKQLLSFADTAMYHAKENRLDICRYEPKMTERLLEVRQLNEKLSGALEREEFSLVYQPQVAVDTGQIVAVEALIRWNHNGDSISPGRFIPLLEQTGRILHVGKWVIQEACRQQKLWRQSGLDIRVAVNVSGVQFSDSHFLDSILDPLREFDVAPEMLEVELTERLLIEKDCKVVQRLQAISELGVHISIDDFGTGYSSLAYLRQFPIDTLKIDRAFVKDVPESDDGTIALSIITLGQTLGMSVLAEGVETVEQLEFLKQHRCDEYQGYFFSRPVAPGEIVELSSDVGVSAGLC